MDIDAPNTKTVLLLAAGELFADYGYDGVSTRMIAEKAGVNLGGIHYHFGSKEALYVEAFKYVCEQDERPNLSGVLEAHPELGATPEGIAQAIYMTCRNFLGNVFDPDKPEWRVRLIVQEISNPSSAFPILVRDVFKRDMDNDMQIYRTIKPDADEDEAMIWLNQLKSPAIFYLIAKAPLVMLRNGKPLDQRFLEKMIRMTATSMILLAGLPLPDELANTETREIGSVT